MNNMEEQQEQQYDFFDTISPKLSKELVEAYYAHDIDKINLLLREERATQREKELETEKREYKTAIEVPGECIRCSRPSVEGSDLCKYHLARQTKRRREIIVKELKTKNRDKKKRKSKLKKAG